MILGLVTGPVHATVKNPHLDGHRLLVVKPVDLSGRPQGRPILSADRVDAGVGDLVLVCREGSSARFVLNDRESPVQAMVPTVVDDLVLHDTDGKGP
ncbi:MAG: EutN/CcmL family microcompartment protein [Planctomycetes bacterium]|nr:EutN/CcmL family microcompartment protein [Planctomycetota bacterium]